MLRQRKVCVLYHKLILLKDACAEDRIVPVKDDARLTFLWFFSGPQPDLIVGETREELITDLLTGAECVPEI